MPRVRPPHLDARALARLSAVRRTLAATLAFAALVACNGVPEPDRTDIPESIRVRTEAWTEGRFIPAVYACPRNESPDVAWSGVPDDAAELALAFEDTDAPGGVFEHWIVFGIKPDVTGFGFGEVPPGARQATNDFGEPGYRGPCPPRDDDPHRYVLTVVALRGRVGLPDGAPAADVRAALDARAMAYGRYVGYYERP